MPVRFAYKTIVVVLKYMMCRVLASVQWPFTRVRCYYREGQLDILRAASISYTSLFGSLVTSAVSRSAAGPQRHTHTGSFELSPG